MLLLEGAANSAQALKACVSAATSAEAMKKCITPTNTAQAISEVLLTALAALVPAAIGAFFKWIQDHSQSRQRAALTERMAGLAKMIGEVPDVAVDVPSAGQGVGTTARAVLTAELTSVTRELAALQVTAGRRAVFSNASSRTRAALLLYRPHGFFAWLLHGLFYITLGLFSMIFMAGLARVHEPNFWYGMLGMVVLSVIPITVHYVAARLHRAYCAKQAAVLAVPGGAGAGVDQAVRAAAVPVTQIGV